MKESKEYQIIIQNNTKEKVESEIKDIAMQFAEDIKEYVSSGGDINDLDANKIYPDTEKKEKEQG